MSAVRPAVLFDLDDTLLNHSGALRVGAEALHAHIGHQASFPDFFKAWEESLRRNFDLYLAGVLTHEGQRRARVRETIDRSLSDSDANRLYGVYLEAYEAAWALFPDVEPLLARLSGCRLGIVTNGQARQQRLKIERLGLRDRVDCVVVSEECGSAKPAPAIFHKACALLGTPPEAAVFVGDLYDVDVLGSRRAGLRGVWLNRRGTAAAHHEPPIVDSLADVGELVGYA